MGILDSIFGSLGYVPQDQQPQTQPVQPQQPPPPGMLDRLMAGVQGFGNSPNLVAGVGNLIGGLAGGVRTDPAGVQGAAIRAQLNELQAQGRINPTQARFLAANPKAWEELSKAMINQPITVGPSGDVLTSGPFGQLTPRGAFPVSERAVVVNPDTGSKSPGFAIKPSLFNPSGSLVQPGMPAQQPSMAQGPIVAPSTTGQSQTASPPLLNPNLPRGGRPIITEASPQATEERQAVGKALGAEYTSITTKAAAATRQLSTLQRMSQLGPQAFQGAAAPGLQFARSLLTSFGIPSNTVAAGTEFTALANKMVLDANNGSLGAGVSNADVQFLANINPNIAQDADGRTQLISTLTKLAKRDQDVAKEAQRYRSQNGGSMDGFQVHIQEWASKPENQLFKDAPALRASFNDRFGAVADGPGARGITIRAIDGKPVR